ncbi:1656_t:CDS:2 [Rhizophagus irregularis]|nr:1656_t:CDS:2 [Rhizophagus irregularis]
MKDCLDSGIENDADLNILRFNGFMSTQWTLYDRSHLKNVYDDPYRLMESARDFCKSFDTLYSKLRNITNTFGTPKFNQLVRRNETVIGAVWFRKLSTNLHVLLAARTMNISLQTGKFDRDS